MLCEVTLGDEGIITAENFLGASKSRIVKSHFNRILEPGYHSKSGQNTSIYDQFLSRQVD
jgi:hypothetical protein